VLVTDSGHAKLIDFGLAQSVGGPQEHISGTTFGTAAYLAPEQVTGGAVDATTDVYALGCVIYEALTGRSPFQTGAPDEVKRDVILAHLEREPVPPSQARPDLELPVWIDDVLRWALAKKPEDRYSDVTTFAGLFHMGTLGGPIVVPGATAPVRSRYDPMHEQTTNVTAVAAPKLALPKPHIRPPRSRTAYRMVGRVARRARWLSRPVRRLATVFLIGNLMLALLLLARGGPPALIGQTARIEPGVPARVIVDGLRLRDNPGTSSGVITSLDEGDRLTVLDQPEFIGGERWWPVRVEEGDGALTGYVWQEGLTAVPWTGRLTWVQEIIDRGTGARDAIANLLSF
ncbi:MAG: serine/threonine protein kinase, partial [Chloroflexota bacterium]|nr:serine/threonine protein kinase [Chloroflexota bacterium]